jgi:hypothetical protein
MKGVGVMKKIKKSHAILCGAILLLAFMANTNLMAATLNQSAKKIADRLADSQLNTGLWTGEEYFMGSIVAGMVDAYELTNNYVYKDSAVLGGSFFLDNHKFDGFLGDEAYALARLSAISDNPNSNKWRTALKFFYYYVDIDAQIGGTQGYIDSYIGTDPSIAVFYLANHTVAAYYIDFYNKELWRNGLVKYLSHVSDVNSTYPVLAMGAATWALAKTSALNETKPISWTQEVPYWDTLIDPSGKGVPYWKNKKLFDLPKLLMSQQVPAGKLNAGSFYWRLVHDVNDPNSGNTEDAVFATMGLKAAVDAAKLAKSTPNYFNSSFGAAYKDPNLFSKDQDNAVSTARQVLLNGITSGGLVFEKLSQQGASYYTYSGEMLQALMAVHVPGDLTTLADLNQDGIVDEEDLDILMDAMRTLE